MAADAYLKGAAAQLQSAAQAIKIQMDELHSSMMTASNELQHAIDKNETEIRALTMRMGLPHDSANGQNTAGEIQKLKADNDNKKQQLNRLQNDTNQAISAKQSAMNDVLNDARNLENKAGNAAFH